MFKPGLQLIFFSFYLSQIAAQDIHLPRGIQRAVMDGTRTSDGKPGRNYWQNRASYFISVSVTPPDRTIRGVEKITYFNNSPDTLFMLNFKIPLNIHRPGAARAEPAENDYLTKGMIIDSFTIGGNKIAWDNNTNSTDQLITLLKPLAPHDSVTMNIGWNYMVSLKSNREGMIDPTTYFLAYFYPRVGVYDDYNGWNQLPFTDLQEFYNDFNNYTLEVSVPEHYLVWATGILQNSKEVLLQNVVSRYQLSMNSDSTIHIVSADDLKEKRITPNKKNTWVWKADNITDMAVGLSNHYVWDAASVTVDSMRRRVHVNAAYSDDASSFHESVQNSRKTISWLSRDLPGISFPFPKMTIFQGFADMEYPMMANDSYIKDLPLSRIVQNHEVSHTYFPFYMGTNESRYSFMDEGWATTFDYFYLINEFGQKAGENIFKAIRIDSWTEDKTVAQELPIITPSNDLSANDLSNNSYGKAALSHLALRDLLGDVLFKQSLRVYMNNWHGKHPNPWDYFNSMSSGSGKNLNWFFNNWFFSFHYIDLAIRNVTKTKTGYMIDIKNIGGFAVPFDVNIVYDNGDKETIHQTPLVWENNQLEISVSVNASRTIKSMRIETGIITDVDQKNNMWNDVN
jgi:hypothetical protein